MIRNYFVVAFRNLVRHKFYSLINIIGLSIGLTCFLFIMLYVVDEIHYDEKLAESGEIYRMDFSGSINGNEFITALMSAPAAPTLKSDYPQVIDAFRFRSTGNWFIKRKGQQQAFKEENVIHADPNMFTFWNIKLLSGDPLTCLDRPHTLVLDQTTARKIFGDEDPVGQTVVLDNATDYEVTGVYEDLPKNMHFHHNVMLTMLDREDSKSPVWMSFNFNTYLKLAPGSNPTELEAKFPALIDSRMGPEIKKFMNMTLEDFTKSGNQAYINLFPLKDIHLHSSKLGDLEANGDIKYVYIFSAIGIFILILACINFMNLATARSANRAKEVGLRKVMGAFQSQLIRQFISEAMLIVLISTILAIGFTAALLPYFNDLSAKELAFSSLLNGNFFVLLGAIVLVVGLLAGSYPAFYLSSFRPVETLKGKLTLGVKSGGLRSVLVVLQFTVSIIMIVGTIIVFNQLSYIQNKKLGFDKEQVIMVHDAWILDKKVESYKNEALRHASILRGTVASFLPVNSTNNNNIYFPGKVVNGDKSYVINNHWVDHDYIETLGMEIVDGRDFSKDFPTDSMAILINETAVKQMGITDPLNDYVSTYDGEDDSIYTVSYKIIGVVKDFHFKSLKEDIAPLVLHLGRNTGYISFKMDGQNPKATIDHLETLWDEFAPGQPFGYSFLNERFYDMYESEQKIGKIFGVFAFLAIFIACLGLFGLASFTAEQKRKEIGIRKVLGASVSHIVNKLSMSFIKLVGVSFLIASPVAYYGMSKWLEDFAYRSEISIWIFLSAGIASAIIAWLTMSFQSWKAARVNPATSLRDQ